MTQLEPNSDAMALNVMASELGWVKKSLFYCKIYPSQL